MTIALVVALLTAATVQADTPLTVVIVTAKAVADEQNVNLTGEIVARDTLSAAFPMAGRVADVLVEAGDKVAKGDVLARIDSVQQEQALRAAEAGLATAEADYRQAVEDLDRQETLLTRGATTRIVRDTADDAVRIADGVLAQAQAEQDRATKALGDTILTAPADATVIARMAERGQVVGAAQPVMDLALGDGFDAVFQVPEVLVIATYSDPVVQISLLNDPNVRFSGTVREVSPLVDQATGTVEVTVSVNDAPAGVGYGAPVRGSVSLEGERHVTLPYTAMSANAEGPAVWVVDPATMAVSLQPIVIGRFETGTIVVHSGITDGMLVVTKGAQLLYQGRVVQRAEGAK